MILPTMTSSNNSAWPALAYADWQDTCGTLHLWTQVVGKVKLALAPLSNHWWGIVLFVTARGLTTGAMPYRDRVLQIDFDFCAHRARVAHQRRARATHRARPMATADFYAAVMTALRALDVDVRIWTMPVEIEGAIPFDQDRVHASYDGAAAKTSGASCAGRPRVQHFPRALPRQSEPGAFLLGLVRSCGDALLRPRGAAIENEQHANVAAWVMNEAYTHECSSVGFWPGNAGYGHAAFYAYAYPEPEGFGAQPVRPKGAAYNADIGQFLIDYDTVRTAASPDNALLDFMQSTYEAAANGRTGTASCWSARPRRGMIPKSGHRF